jgi:hypothetical protein
VFVASAATVMQCSFVSTWPWLPTSQPVQALVPLMSMRATARDLA